MKFKFELDHIGIAVENLEQGVKFYEALGFEAMQIEDVPSEKVRTGFLKLENHSTLELLEPTSDDSVIKKFLEKRGPGIHHICLRVKDIEAVVQNLKSKGMRMINETPKLGAHHCKVVFVHPASTGGILLELSEPQE
jgi:methylmalonyl-CoA/ethylmalonyl-CoA epimerase